MKYIIGFDGGGTKTRCILADTQGNVLEDHLDGPSNHQTIGLENTKKVIQSLFETVITRAQVDVNDINYIFLGLAGADLPTDFEALNGICKSIFLHIPFEVVNDAWIIMRSGTEKPYGVVSIYGTGANAGAITETGQMHILRALSYTLGGAGGGGDIIADAFHYAFRSNEKTYHSTALEIELPKLLNTSSIEALIEGMYPECQYSQNELNKIPPLVFDLAKSGDLVCQEILENKGRIQGEMVNGIVEQSGMTNTAFPVVMGGSIYKGSSDDFIKAFKNTILEKSPLAHFNFSELEPVAGAYLFAMDRLGRKLTPTQEQNFKEKMMLKK